MTKQLFQSYATFARTPEGFVLSVLTKRSYGWSANGLVHGLGEQPPLCRDITRADRDDRNGQIVTQGRDVWPLKPATDVIVTGHAHAPAGTSVRELPIEVRVGAHSRRIIALGPRFVERRSSGRITFSQPEPLQSVELSWWNAYGGIDPMVLPRGLSDTPVFAGKPTLELFPGAYPRNPSGTGYLIRATPALLDGLTLPQLEDPEQRLTPETLLVDDPKGWWKRPLPAGFGWCHALWFPRIIHCGGKPYHWPLGSELSAVREAQLGLLSGADEAGEIEGPSLHMTNEAAPGMILPYLKGDEPVELVGVSREGALRFVLEAEQATINAQVDAQGLRELQSVIHTLAVDADKRQLYIVRSTRFLVPDAMQVDLSAELPLDDAIARTCVTVDGLELTREHWPDSMTGAIEGE